MLRELLPHQREMKRHINHCHGQAGIGAAPGTCKTLVAIRRALFVGPPVLVICRRDDFLTWLTELDMEGEIDRQFIESGDATLPDEPSRWTMVTYDLVKNPRIKFWIMSHDFSMVIADECHQIKRWASQRTKSVVRATRHIPERLGMTGTPLTNHILDIYSQSLFIDGGKTFGDSEWAFLNKYFLREGKGWYERRTAADEISKKMRRLWWYVHEDDVLKLPPIRRLIKSCRMTRLQQQLYNRVVEEWEIELRDQLIEIDHVIVKMAKLRQIAQGFFYGAGGEPQHIPCPKYDLLIDVLDEIDLERNKAVVWASHRAELERICRALEFKKVNHIYFQGGQKTKEAARRDFRDNPDIRVFVSQVDRGVGMNELIVAKHAVYFSNSLKVISRQQSLRRIRRKGSEHHDSITYWDLISEGSLDYPILSSIGKSISLAHIIQAGLTAGKPLRELIS